MKFTQKNPQRTNNIQSGEAWQLPFSKIKGPIRPILVKNSGLQLTPIPVTKGVKWAENGQEKIKNEEARIKNEEINFQDKPKRKKKIIIVKRI